MIERDLVPHFRLVAAKFPAVTLTGPRQSGKSTLCRALFSTLGYANLEAPDIREFALQDSRAFLAQYPKGAVLDEVQRAPDLASYLQPLIDNDPTPGRWILTGSQNFSLLQSVSQSLAGRSAILHLLPLTRAEIERFDDPPASLEETMFRGGYPAIYDRHIEPSVWLSSYTATYIDRDVRTLANIGDLTTFQRFVELCAGRTGQLVNYSALAADAGISQPTAKAWLSILQASFIVFLLPPWSGNIRKRLVKMPKLHFYDTGLACWLLGLRSAEQLRTHPLRGAIFESWVISELLKQQENAGERQSLYFYRDKNAVEADLLIETAQGITVVEIKAGQTVTDALLAPARRIRETLSQVKKTQAVTVYGGEAEQRRSEVRVVPWNRLQGLMSS
jgi:predicted AAA+ superfamily ATPase